MKALLIMLLVLIPIAHADNNILEARKTNLEARASEFIAQMKIAIDFAQNKSINSSALEGLKSNFEDKLEEALESEARDNLSLKEKEMREIADEFRKEVKSLLKDYIDELKDEIKKSKSSIVTKVLNDIKGKAEDIKKEADKEETNSDDMDVEEAKETLRNSFSGIIKIFDKLKLFLTSNAEHIEGEK